MVDAAHVEAGVQRVPAGDIWTWTAICADTKLVPSWYVAALGVAAVAAVAGYPVAGNTCWASARRRHRIGNRDTHFTPEATAEGIEGGDKVGGCEALRRRRP